MNAAWKYLFLTFAVNIALLILGLLSLRLPVARHNLLWWLIYLRLAAVVWKRTASKGEKVAQPLPE